MPIRPQAGVIGGAVFAPRSPAKTSRMRGIGGGAAEVMKQIIGYALLPKVRKAN